LSDGSHSILQNQTPLNQTALIQSRTDPTIILNAGMKRQRKDPINNWKSETIAKINDFNFCKESLIEAHSKK
jgi:hypothetical protein